jgi:Protein of unknown function (DUF3040)
MPLSEHEQRILEQYEKELQQDPHLSKRIGRSSLYSGVARRIRFAVFSFFAGFVMLMLFFVSLPVSVAGFVVMLLSGLVIYHYLKRVGRDQLMARGGRLPMAGWLARLGDRFRGRPDKTS